MNSANVSRDKNCGKRKTKTTQKRKGPSSNKPQKIATLLPFVDRGELELSQPDGNRMVLHEGMPI